MIRLSKLTDYGFVLLNRFVADREGEVVHNARDLAEETSLPLPTVSKLLKALTRGGLLTARRGVKGGYVLARPAQAITAADVIEALEGPVALTDCSVHSGEDCSLEHNCPIRPHWVLITEAVRAALDRISLLDMAQGPAEMRGALIGAHRQGPGGTCSCGMDGWRGHGNSFPGRVPCTCSLDLHAQTQTTRRGDGQ